MLNIFFIRHQNQFRLCQPMNRSTNNRKTGVAQAIIQFYIRIGTYMHQYKSSYPIRGPRVSTLHRPSSLHTRRKFNKNNKDLNQFQKKQFFSYFSALSSITAQHNVPTENSRDNKIKYIFTSRKLNPVSFNVTVVVCYLKFADNNT